MPGLMNLISTLTQKNQSSSDDSDGSGKKVTFADLQKKLKKKT